MMLQRYDFAFDPKQGLPVTFAVAFLAGCLMGFTGFGFNLIAVPLLALLLPTQEAIVSALIAGVVISLIVGLRYRSDTNWVLVSHLFSGCLPGLFLGVWLFSNAPDRALRIGIGVVCLASAIWLLKGRSRVLVEPRLSLSGGAGVVSGLLTATTGMGGPPAMIYLMASLRNGRQVRATISMFTGLAGGVAVASLWAAGPITHESLNGVLFIVPGAVAGMVLGSTLFSRFGDWHSQAVAMTLTVVTINGVALAVTS